MSACKAMRVIAGAGSAVLVLAFDSRAVDAPAPASAQGFDAFRLVQTRNIFDPERRAMVRESESRPATAPSRPHSIALTGTMVTPSKQLAFFAGSRSDFHKVIGVREKIGDCTVTGISSTHVDLERGGKPFVLAVGKQLTLDGSGAITAAIPGDSAPGSVAPPATTAPSMPAPGGEAAPPPPSGDKAELLRRMMERRAQEMSK